MAQAWAKYKIKKNRAEEVRERITNRKLAEIIGIDEGYVSQIMHGRKVTKVIAYAMCKAISPVLEIHDLFNEEE